MKISACWIAKNEEKNIARSINSLKAVCDEIVVVDTGSEDGTVRAAEEAGARVEFFEWINDFSAAKNYALSRTGGDIVIFLDADEWFSPSLTKSDKSDIEQFFKSNPKAHAVQINIHNLNSQGAVKTVSAGNRIIKRAGGVLFQKPVHEQLLLKNGNLIVAVPTEKWPVFHSGYSEDILEKKMQRNIALLEYAAEHAGSAEDRHMQHCYLVREYFNLRQLDDSLRHLRAVLDEPEILKSQIRYYRVGLVPLLYCMLISASEMRGKVSRLELYHKIVEPFKRYLEEYRGAATIDLFYSVLFDVKEDMLLERLGDALLKSQRLPETSISYYKDAEATLNLHAAEASLKRGKQAQAMDYAIVALKEKQNLQPQALRVLLKCIKGQSPQDIIMFLNSQFDIKNPHVLEHLVPGTRLDGFQEVHAYYLNKKITAQIATKIEYLLLLMLYGKDAEAAKAAFDFYGDKNKGLAATYIFLSAVCSKNKEIYLEYKELLTPVSDMLDAYFEGVRLDAPTNESLMVLLENFKTIAFTAGLKRACELLNVFSSNPILTFNLKAKYCVENGIYSAPLEDVFPDTDNHSCNRLLIECLYMSNRCTEAVDILERMFYSGKANRATLRQALAIYDKTGDMRAKRLYDEYMPEYDRLTDLTDIVNTGYIPPEYKKKHEYTPHIPEKINGINEMAQQAAEIIANKTL